MRARIITSCAALLLMAASPASCHSAMHSARAAPGPSVYWASSPTLVNETLIVAGSFPGRNTHAKLCSTSDCVAGSQVPTPGWAPSAWTHSVKLVLPPHCGALCHGSGRSICCTSHPSATGLSPIDSATCG